MDTRFDLNSELSDAQEAMDAAKADALAARCGRMVGWIGDLIMEAHQIIQNLDAATQGDSARDLGGAWLLVTESAFNELNFYNEIARLLPNEP
jgi:hypothetical protein